ncbi:MAG: phosphate ABC transporter substrate-binding protein [Chlorobiaceae bacterium]|nr:phosphate ABC transporter substrate-binding protein [Chlorobiaceae bacterium]
MKTVNMFRRVLFGASVFGLMVSGNAMAEGKKLVLDGSTTVGPLAKAFASHFTKTTGIEVTVSESGSGNGAKSLINKTCDIADMSRPMKENELEAAKGQGVTPVQNVVALDGLAMIVHPSNRVKGLTKEQIRGIYTGTVTNWKDVGGAPAPIVVIQRESNSGTQDSFKELALDGAKVSEKAETQASNGAIKTRVATTKNAIGFIGLGFVDRSVKALPIDGIKAEVKTVKNGTYPLHRKLFMYTNGQPKGDIKKFVDIPKTPAGKKMINEIGFVNNY